MRSKPIMREIKVSKHKFRLEIYPNLEGHQDITWEIYPEDYHAALYALVIKKN